eukprot:7137429-Prymnesium_polylepis.1
MVGARQRAGTGRDASDMTDAKDPKLNARSLSGCVMSDVRRCSKPLLQLAATGRGVPVWSWPCPFGYTLSFLVHISVIVLAFS